MKLDARDAATVEYLDPVIPRKNKGLYVPSADNLVGKRIGFLENGWKSFVKIGAHLEHVLVTDYGISGFNRYSIPTSVAAAPALLDTVAAECDAAIVGMAN